jgi:hypothetical protein
MEEDHGGRQDPQRIVAPVKMMILMVGKIFSDPVNDEIFSGYEMCQLVKN